MEGDPFSFSPHWDAARGPFLHFLGLEKEEEKEERESFISVAINKLSLPLLMLFFVLFLIPSHPLPSSPRHLPRRRESGCGWARTSVYVLCLPDGTFKPTSATNLRKKNHCDIYVVFLTTCSITIFEAEFVALVCLGVSSGLLLLFRQACLLSAPSTSSL